MHIGPFSNITHVLCEIRVILNNEYSTNQGHGGNKVTLALSRGIHPGMIVDGKDDLTVQDAEIF